MPTQMEKYFPNDVLYEHGKYSTAYLFSTESPHIFSNIDVRGKNVLAVASGGGDTALYALDAGAKSVELFDISRHALLAVELKYAAFRNLPLSEFKEMFDINLNEPSIDFDWGIYEYKLRPELSKESLECMKFVEEHQSYLFDSRFAKRRYRFYETPYLQDPETYERYKKLAQRTPESKLLDIRADKPFAEVRKKYDVIYLSNINWYAHDKQEVLDNIASVKKILAPGGTIIADYRYHVIDAVHDNDESIQLYSKIPGFKAGTQKFKPHKFKTDFYDAAMNDPDRKPDEMPMDRMIVLSRDDR